MSVNELANPWVAGLAVYEPGRPIEEVARDLGFDSIEQIVKLASNENALGPSPRAVEAMREAAAQMHRYPDGGAFYLRRELARRLDVAPENLIVTAGSNEAIELLAHVFLRPGTGIVMSERAFVVYRLVAAASRAETVAVPMRGFTHDLDAMLAAIRPETRLVFISNPNNPTGTMVGPEEIDRFLNAVPEHVVTVMDEAYIELADPGRRPDCLRYVREGRRLAVLRTFSKVYGLAGLRIGYAVAPEPGIALLHRVRQPFNVNAMALAAALAALDDVEHVERTRAATTAGRQYLEKAVEAMGLSRVPSVANFFLVKVDDGRNVFTALQRHGVIVRPMDGYGLPEYIRITVGTAAENERCVRALRQVLNRK